MRASNTYRAARKAEVAASGGRWRDQAKVRLSVNDETVYVPTKSAPSLFSRAPKRRPSAIQPGGAERLVSVAKASVERLHGVAIKGPDGRAMAMARGSHSDLRRQYNIVEHDTDFEHGFMTDASRFVTRNEARIIAVASGQLGPQWAKAGREVLSSDVDWDGRN